MKVYTKAGDKGVTSLFGGTKIHKDDIKIEAYGTVDELNSQLGVLLSMIPENEINNFILKLQNVLFDVGSHLASDGSADKFLPELKVSIVESLESEMDKMTAALPELKSFILPRGNLRIATTHVCRTVCRRAERRVVSLSRKQEIPDFIIVFLNRLSDYFFVLARFLGQSDGIDEEKWVTK